jgi:adenosylcobinamide-phosphate synthase
MMSDTLTGLFPLLLGWLLDLVLGDPSWLPHPVVGFGKMIAFFEHRLNKGNHRILKGALVAVCLIAGIFIVTSFLISDDSFFDPGVKATTGRVLISALLIFYCLAGTTSLRTTPRFAQ